MEKRLVVRAVRVALVIRFFGKDRCQSVDLRFRQGRSRLAPAGAAALRRGRTRGENAAGGGKVPVDNGLLHVASVLPSHVIQRSGNLSQGTGFDRRHEFGEDIVAGQGRLLETLERRRRLVGVTGVEI